MQARGLTPGSRFVWWMSNDGSVRLSDIDSDLPKEPQLSDSEDEERRCLRETSKRRFEEGTFPPDYAGDGL
jgi:hypothetical protein